MGAIRQRCGWGLAGALAAAAAAGADTLNVPGDFATIQAAINAATDFDEIVVGPGTYFELLDLLGKKVHLRSSDGPALTTINGGGAITVVTMQSGESPATILEGFTVTGTVPNGFGEGTLLIKNGSATIRSCIFDSNVNPQGGGINVQNGNVDVADCTFSDNISLGYGGGICCFTSTVTVHNGVFSGNSGFHGGAIFMSGGSLTVTDCTFGNNQAMNGGAIHLASTATATVTGSSFTGNSASSGGGGIRTGNFGNLSVSGCTFTSNTAQAGGGAYIDFGFASSTFTDCLFMQNHAQVGGAMTGATLLISRCTFEGNTAVGWGGGLSATTVSVTDSLFRANTAGQGASGHGGGGLRTFDGTLVNCAFVGNSANPTGGAIRNEWGNTAIGVINCTIADNSAADGGGLYHADGPYSPFVRNCVIWGNSSGQLAGTGAEATVGYSIIQGGFPGAGNVDADPLFVDAAGGNVRVSAGSPAIDAADNTSALGVSDLDGNPRFVADPCTEDTGVPDGYRPPVDMGAYEFQVACPWDLDCNGSVGIVDFLALLVGWGTFGDADFDRDGAADVDDFLALLSNWGACPG